MLQTAAWGVVIACDVRVCTLFHLGDEPRQLQVGLKPFGHLRSGVFVNTRVSVNIVCKHEGAVHRGRTRCTSQTARVAHIGSMCSSRIRGVRELSKKGQCLQLRRCLQMVVGLTDVRYDSRDQWDEQLSAGRFDHSPMAV